MKGQELVGRRLAIRWTGDPGKPWYAARVAEYRPFNGAHLLAYDDGEQHEHNLAEEFAAGQLRWEASNASSSVSASRSPTSAETKGRGNGKESSSSPAPAESTANKGKGRVKEPITGQGAIDKDDAPAVVKIKRKGKRSQDKSTSLDLLSDDVLRVVFGFACHIALAAGALVSKRFHEIIACSGDFALGDLQWHTAAALAKFPPSCVGAGLTVDLIWELSLLTLGPGGDLGVTALSTIMTQLPRKACAPSQEAVSNEDIALSTCVAHYIGADRYAIPFLIGARDGVLVRGCLIVKCWWNHGRRQDGGIMHEEARSSCEAWLLREGQTFRSLLDDIARMPYHPWQNEIAVGYISPGYPLRIRWLFGLSHERCCLAGSPSNRGDVFDRDPVFCGVSLMEWGVYRHPHGNMLDFVVAYLMSELSDTSKLSVRLPALDQLCLILERVHHLVSRLARVPVGGVLASWNGILGYGREHPEFTWPLRDIPLVAMKRGYEELQKQKRGSPSRLCIVPATRSAPYYWMAPYHSARVLRDAGTRATDPAYAEWVETLRDTKASVAAKQAALIGASEQALMDIENAALQQMTDEDDDDDDDDSSSDDESSEEEIGAH